MNLSRLIEQKRREKAIQAKKKTAKTLATGATLGVIAGALSGLLLAPKSGKETMNDLKDATKDAHKKFKNKANIASTNCKNNILDAKSKIKDYLNNKNISKKTVIEVPEEIKEDIKETIVEETTNSEDNK